MIKKTDGGMAKRKMVALCGINESTARGIFKETIKSLLQFLL